GAIQVTRYPRLPRPCGPSPWSEQHCPRRTGHRSAPGGFVLRRLGGYSEITHDRYRQSLLGRANLLLISQVRHVPDFHGHNATSASNAHCFVKRDRKILPPKPGCLLEIT